MREIKFRAWDKIRKKMYDSVFYSYDRKTGIMNLDTDLGVIHFSERQAFELIQYTGLKDKNNKEIYEGDIIEFDYNCKTNRFAVEFLYGAYCFDTPGGLWFLKRFNREQIKVIGNIHQNPERMREINTIEELLYWR